ncbi:NADH oxidase [Colletotrichum salicis]|uniref:NADH oxidase n=1 Tax=Colletotrichum salicis TaxID=1209931 RepID=A0A135UKZ3_9PEZI|nr:NADH oxidase [Colletotrichum salicis]
MEFAPPREAAKQDIARFIDGFAHAAAYLEKAGFDGIQLHAAHGYLLAQFLSRTTNRRTDEYGPQTLENRTRLIAEIGKAVKQRTWPGFILSAKTNSVEFQEGGVTSDEAREMSEDAAARKTKAYIVGGMRTVGAMVKGRRRRARRFIRLDGAREPFDASDEGSVGRFVQDMQAWYGDLVADGDKLEHYGAVKFSGETVP